MSCRKLQKFLYLGTEQIPVLILAQIVLAYSHSVEKQGIVAASFLARKSGCGQSILNISAARTKSGRQGTDCWEGQPRSSSAIG